MTNERRACVPGFEEDIFVSYGHIDNQGTLPWVERLCESLRVRLEELLGTSDVRIWRDVKLDGLDRFDEEIHRKISSAALFLAVLSPRYAASEWCAREVDAFAGASSTPAATRLTSK